MTKLMRLAMACALGTMGLAGAADAQTAREWLTQAGFVDRDKAVALAHIDRADQAADAVLAKSPGDEEASLMKAMALGYRAKLTSSRTMVIAARKQYEALIGRFPRSAEAEMALGAWHVALVKKLGGFVARAAAGAQRSVGMGALDKAVAMGGNRAMLAGFAGMMRLQLDPDDKEGQALVERASKAPAPTPVDVLVRRAANAVMAEVRAGNDAAVKTLSDRLLPFGYFS
jgi:hypothetical protein